MKYALLIHHPERIIAQIPEAEMQAQVEEHRKLQKDARLAKHYGGSVRLAPTQTATSVRTRGKRAARHGRPYAETRKPWLGSIWWTARTSTRPIAYARRIPVAPTGDHRESGPVFWQEPAMKLED